MIESIIHVLQYFSTFSYPPTIKETHLFLNKKIGEREFNYLIEKLIKEKRIIKQGNRLTLYKDHFKIFKKREKIAQRLLLQSFPYLKQLGHIPTVQFVGISGSLSMHNTSTKGDIDLFIITQAHTIWITRFIILLYKYLVIAINKEIGVKFCLNLFFSVKGLNIPSTKQNEYIGHEILQLKPILDKNNLYDTFLASNKWVKHFFPQVSLSKAKLPDKTLYQSKLIKFLDNVLQRIQTWWLRKKGYAWHFHNEQLWLIQEDFESKALSNRIKIMS